MKMSDLDKLVLVEKRARLKGDKRLLSRLTREKIESSRTSLLDFTQYLRPDPKAEWDVTSSEYEVAKHHKLVAEELEKLERGETRKLILSLPPRAGKSTLAVNSFIPWYIGRNPHNSVIMTTYNQNFAGDFGRSVREAFRDPRYANVFDAPKLVTKSQAADRMNIEGGGQLSFVGRMGSLTGRGGDLLIIDDAIKDRQDADSALLRGKMWDWFHQVFRSRGMTEDARILIIGTRWTEDDITGRLIDPKNDHYNRREAATWKVINLPALAETDDPLGRNPGEPLWPSRFGSGYLASLRDQDPRGFSALYQGTPTPDEGLFFDKTDIVEYQDMREIPEGCRYYAASDHAISQAQTADYSVFIIFAVDDEDNIWILPDTVVNRLSTDQAVDVMLALIKKYHPMFWWAERGHISAAIGPFLRKRMAEEGVYATIQEINPTRDKQSRAQSIKGRMATGKVRFPAWTAWYGRVRQEILTFPAGAHDDFVDALSMIGMGLSLQISPKSGSNRTGPVPGTFGYLKEQSRQQDRRNRIYSRTGGW